MTSFFFRLLFFIAPVCVVGQIVDDIIVQPALNVSWHNNYRLSFNTAIQQRTRVTNSTESLHIQIAQFVQYEIGFYSKLGIGVMYRELFDDSRPEELRLTEQYVFAKKYNQLKLAHRLRWDQRLRDDRITHRWRYRLSGSIPLSGNKVDASEYYVSGSVETLFIAETQTTPAYDQRLAIAIGRQMGSNYKLQLTTQYRWEDFTQDNTRLLFINLSLYANL